MTGLDTNILVRYLTQDDPIQARKATQAIDESSVPGTGFFLAAVVMCELGWVLESAYAYTREQVVST